ncbi:MAG TPA: nucleoside triphosphate pyrophosphohydrolase, partial [Chloroflexi bacterium]|nr:nucleoside triphosphate pyrophosphohydrolase [Chloroflexota bacterium]
MAGITIVGLGPGAPELLTRAAWQILSDASEIWLRTLHHPVVAALPPDLTLHSFDALYEKADTFA